MNCRSCNGTRLELILDLGHQPWCNDFLTKDQVGKENTYPLRLYYCLDCEMLQLDHTVPKETMFSDTSYLSGMTQTLQQHFFNLAKENIEQFNIQPQDLVVDIGGNDGCQMLQYKKAGVENVLNVECSKRVANISSQAGVKTLNKYFNLKTVQENLGEKSVKLYNASGVFFHLEELHSVIEGIKYSLKDDGVLIVQFMYAGVMVENLNFDSIYHEHLCLYTIRSLNNLLKLHQLEIFDASYSDIHSGSIIAKIGRSERVVHLKTQRFYDLLEKDSQYTLEAFKQFAKKVESKKNHLRQVLEKYKSLGKKIYAYGAPAKGNTLLNYFKIDHKLVDKAVEVNELKVGHYLPKSHIPITLEDENDFPDYYLLLSHNFADELIKKNAALIDKGVQFIIPFPEVEVVGSLGREVVATS